jgi:hypothetical protein
MGRRRYPTARALTITADCGGSNGAQVRLWKVELQKLADQTGLIIHVHHYPPSTSKWNKIEHRLFCYITQTWRGRPLTDRLAVVELIGATTTTTTTTTTGLKVESVLDTSNIKKELKSATPKWRVSTSKAMHYIPNGTTPSDPTNERHNRRTNSSACPKMPTTSIRSSTAISSASLTRLVSSSVPRARQGAKSLHLWRARVVAGLL